MIQINFNSLLTNQIFDSAIGSIPECTHTTKAGVPSWNNECNDSKRSRQRAYNKLRGNIDKDNDTEYKGNAFL